MQKLIIKRKIEVGKIRTEIDSKKIFFSNDVKQTKISDIIGKVNTVIFTPDTIDIIKDDPETRRKFLNMMISSLRPNYIHQMNLYKNALLQRNNYLRQIKFEKKSESMLDIWDEQLSELSYNIYKYRNFYMQKIFEKINIIHKQITKSGKLSEVITIKYISDSKNKEEFLKKIKESREIDIKRGFTGVRST